MPIIDIIIAVVIAISVIVGIVRGFVKESISLAALLFAIWGALYFGPEVGTVSRSWLSSEELQIWFGRILVFACILIAGGLLGWAVARLVRLSVLSGMDRFVGAFFGAARGMLLVAVAIIGGQFAGFNNDGWWLGSRLIPHFELVAEWIRVMAPRGFDMLTPEQQAEASSVSSVMVAANRYRAGA